MRLTEQQRAVIRTTVAKIFGPNAKVWLFGSRVDDRQRGGDIDLFIKTDLTDVEAITRAEIALLTQLYRQLGEQKIDVLLDYPSQKIKPPIFAIAEQQGIPL
jgi:predicted nucleotidyltransferase